MTPTGVTAYLNQVAKYVVSSTMTDPEWENSTVLAGDPVEQTKKLKSQPGKDIVLTGSISLAHTLIAAGLVDEYRLFVYPTVQGGGRRLFPDGATIPRLALVEPPKSFASGITLLRYARGVIPPIRRTRLAVGQSAVWTSSIRTPQERWDDDRDETEAQRLDRNWSSLLQELRVAQTGVQLLTGFLLILPFQPRFAGLDAVMRIVYLITVSCSIGATVLLVAPVSMHRLLFRRHRLKTLVAVSHKYAIIGTMLLGTALSGVAVVIFDSVVGRTGAWIAGGCTLVALIAFWYALPLRDRDSRDTSY